MDQIKTGKFIAQQRKAKNYTQKQLAEKLMISDKTVSKWECGKGFPEVSLLLPLCNELEITVNELLSGEILPEQEYKMKAEENIMKLVEERQESKKKIILSAVVAGIVVLAGVPLFVISGVESLTLPARIALIIIGLVVIAAGIIVACILDREAGAFECPNCKTRFVPDMKAYIMAPHTITKRKLKCPHCNKRSYCRHVMTKSDE
ncbi:MAG: helix-turn-helix domain-containing protein [Eubacterium sp.]